MAQTGSRYGRAIDRLTDDQWHDLMRSLIEDVDSPGDEDAENLLLQAVASRDGGESPS